MAELTLRNAELRNLVETLKGQYHRKHDMIVPAHSLNMRNDATVTVQDAPLPDALNRVLSDAGVAPAVDAVPGGADLPYNLLSIAHADFAGKLGIPKRYYDRMLEERPELLARNVNTWLGSGGGNYMVRTFRPENEDGSRGILRALLSDRYFIMDNLDILFTALKTVKGLGINADVRSCNLTHNRMYVNFVLPGVTIDAAPLARNYRNPESGGRNIEMTAGFVISNSEVGRGSHQILPRPVLNVCTNSVTWKDDEIRRVHLGGQLEKGVVQWSEDTRRKAVDLTTAQVRDAVQAFATRDYLEGLVHRMVNNGAARELEHPVEALKNASEHAGLTEGEQEDVLGYFARSGDTRRMGVVNALTYHAQQVPDADKQYEIESATESVLKNMDAFDVKPEQHN